MPRTASNPCGVIFAAKPLSKKPKRSFIGLVKVVEGLVSTEELEKDFRFHLTWGKLGRPLNVILYWMI